MSLKNRADSNVIRQFLGVLDKCRATKTIAVALDDRYQVAEAVRSFRNMTTPSRRVNTELQSHCLNFTAVN